jgi:hypothetical protein
MVWREQHAGTYLSIMAGACAQKSAKGDPSELPHRPKAPTYASPLYYT